MKNDTDNRKKYAPPLRSKVRIGNTTFTVNSYFPNPATDTVKDKVQRLIKDELRRSPETKYPPTG